MTRKRAELLTALFEVFNRQPTPMAIKAYELGLRGLSDEQVERAVLAAITACKFCPVVAELIELAGVSNVSQRATLAFTALDDAIARHGGYRNVSFDDPVINATVRSLGGWRRVCDMTEDEFGRWYRRDFIDAYQRLSTTEIGDDMTRPLSGLVGESPVVGVRTGLPWARREAPGIGQSRHQPIGLLEVKRP